MERKYCVYMHTAPNGKVYIGITCRKPKKRWDNGNGYKNNPHFYNAITKYGWGNFTHDILFADLSKEEAEAKEIELISKYDSTNRTKGYNHELGGNAQGKVTDEIKKKISEARKGKCTGAEHPRYGKTFSAEHRRKLSEARRGKIISEETRKKISESSKGDKSAHCKPIVCVNTGIVYSNALKIEAELGINRANICSCCKGKRKTAGGFRWQYAT